MMNPLEEKKMLIESMKKLVSHVTNNRQRQFQIFEALSHQDLNKIIINLRDENEYLRRISALLLCELFFLNSHTKRKAVELLSLVPTSGRVCLGGIPQSISKYPSTLKRCIELMKGPIEEGEEDKMCWTINLERKILRLETMDFKNYSSFTFLDPQKNIFGFTLRQSEAISPRKEEGRAPKKYESPLQAPSETNQEFYKNYVDAIRKTSESKRSSFQGNYINFSGGGQTDRPQRTADRLQPKQNQKYIRSNAPHHLNVTLTPTVKKDSLRTSMEMTKISPNQTMTLDRSNMGIDRLSTTTPLSQGQFSNPGKYIPMNYGRMDQSESSTPRVRGVRVKSGREEAPKTPGQDKFFNRIKQILHK